MVGTCFERLLGFHVGLIGKDLFLSKSGQKTWERWLFFKMHRKQCKTTRSMKNGETLNTPRSKINLTKEMDIYELPGKQ